VQAEASVLEQVSAAVAGLFREHLPRCRERISLSSLGRSEGECRQYSMERPLAPAPKSSPEEAEVELIGGLTAVLAEASSVATAAGMAELTLEEGAHRAQQALRAHFRVAVAEAAAISAAAKVPPTRPAEPAACV
jgi:hypothetical protein